MGRCRNIVFLLFLLSAACGCGRKAKVIPGGDFVDILADMYVADQLVLQNSALRRMADTSSVYEPIFESYGYGLDDYLATERYYMGSPNRYARIVRKASAKLDKKLQELKEQERIAEKARDLQERIARYGSEGRPGFYIADTLLLGIADTLLIGRDSVRRDTAFRGPLIVTDTLPAPADSTTVRDSFVFRVPLLEENEIRKLDVKLKDDL